nr:integrase, catalytic region, zinc finger, CCHC-type, peptidase aspartic, catalytic [Tanacetum cinerariifolium]
MFDCDEMFTSETDESLPASLIYDRYYLGDGYHVVPLPYTGTFMPPKTDLVFHDAPNIPQNAPSFVQPTEQVKPPRPSVKTIETSIPYANHKTTIQKPYSNGNRKNRKACFVCRTNCPLVFGLRLFKTYDGGWLTAYEFREKVHRDHWIRECHFGGIMGYEDYVIGDSVISRVYYVEGLGHNLFSVKQFCDSDLEVAFRKHYFYVRDTDGVELIKGSRGSNLYTISVEDMMKSSPICLLPKAFKNKSWLWHQRLNHLNFGTINNLARNDLVRGLPRLNFKKDHLYSAYQLG